MTMISAQRAIAGDALIDQLQLELGAILTARIIEAEAADFYWEARVKERYLGRADVLVEEDEDLSRVAIMSRLDGAWHVGTAIVDGNASPVELQWRKRFDAAEEAEIAFCRVH